jgi:hypothetical protein
MLISAYISYLHDEIYVIIHWKTRNILKKNNVPIKVELSFVIVMKNS